MTDDEYLKTCERNAAQLLHLAMDQCSSKTLSPEDKANIALASMSTAAAKLIAMIVSHLPDAPIEEAMDICHRKFMGPFTAMLKAYADEVPAARAQVMKDKARGVYD
jgi:hypothetical protein